MLKSVFTACLVLNLLISPAYAHEHRSSAERHRFLVVTGYPHGRPGWTVDHVVPLACGGADEPANLQWETQAEAKAKDRWERYECRTIGGRREGCCH